MGGKNNDGKYVIDWFFVLIASISSAGGFFSEDLSIKSGFKRFFFHETTSL